ncbi:uncharacterized protein G6M90_00g102040 [Metarhizium brunneum]|uniref:Siderophore biosynthesis n=1 Tax=Metarhizium brunneum TaxID=500148 RepID=A0A7D5Z3E1_9HYPO
MVKAALSVLLPLLLAAGAAAFGCNSISYTTCQDRIVHWYDPDDGQICDPHDCGGGRAPPRKDVPGCAFYTGTETLKTEPSYLPCWKPSTAMAAPTGSSVKSSVESTPTNTGVVASSKETTTGSSVPASTTASVAPSTTASSATGSVPGAAASPSTTLPATISTTTQSETATFGNNTGNTSTISTTSAHTGDAGRLVGASKMALVAGIVGGFALL